MKLTTTCWSFMLLLSATSAHAQMYKWVGPDGKVTYSDMPPPQSVSRVQQKNLEVGGSDTSNFPYELAQAVKNSPVTLYTSTKCLPCDDARNFLNGRGIPFKEKTISSNEDIARLRQAGGDEQLPLLLIGRNKQNGFESGAWTTMLTAAGYPETNKLPGTYRNPPAEAAAPATSKSAANNPPAATKDNNADRPENSSAAPISNGNAPPRISFLISTE